MASADRLPGAGGGQLLACAQQNPQGLAIAVRARGGQFLGVLLQGVEHREVGIHEIGFTPTPAGLAGGLLGLDHRDSRAGGRPGQPNAVTTSPLDRQHQPWAGGVLEDPGQCLGVTAAVVAERTGGDHRAAGMGDLDLVKVAVGVGPNDRVDDL
jgi:hypothetical protein